MTGKTPWPNGPRTRFQGLAGRALLYGSLLLVLVLALASLMQPSATFLGPDAARLQVGVLGVASSGGDPSIPTGSWFSGEIPASAATVAMAVAMVLLGVAIVTTAASLWLLATPRRRFAAWLGVAAPLLGFVGIMVARIGAWSFGASMERAGHDIWPASVQAVTALGFVLAAAMNTMAHSPAWAHGERYMFEDDRTAGTAG